MRSLRPASRFLSVVLLACASGCANYARQTFDESSKSTHKRVAVVGFGPAQYSINVITTGAGVFGALGGAVVASDMLTKSETITQIAREHGSPDISGLIVAGLERELRDAGYEVVPPTPDIVKFALAPPDSSPDLPGNPVDATILVRVVSAGFWADSAVSDYRPSIRVAITLTSTRTRTVLYTERLGYGMDYRNSSITPLLASARYAYPDFDSLVSHSAEAFEGLNKGTTLIVAYVASAMRLAVNPAGQTVLGADVTFPRRMFAAEIVEHYARNSEIQANASTTAFTLTMRPGGRVTRSCDTCPIRSGDGEMSLKEQESQVCFQWIKIPYPPSGCFRLFQTSADTFELRAVERRALIRYSGK